MGLNIDGDHFEEDDYARLAQRLREDMRALAELLSRERFGAPSLGAEIEMSMVVVTCRPRPINERVLADTCGPRFTVELNRFNLKCNTLPISLARTPFSSLGKQLDECRTRLRAILPTLTVEDLEPSAMTNLPRYPDLADSGGADVLSD